MALCISSSSSSTATPSSSSPSPYPPSLPSVDPTVIVLSKSTLHPDRPSTLHPLKLSVSDLPMLSVNYIQKGLLFTSSSSSSTNVVPTLISSLSRALSRALSFFPPLAGRFRTDSEGAVYVDCNDEGVEFVHAVAPGVSSPELVVERADVAKEFRDFFVFDGVVSFQGHYHPLAGFQITELGDGSIFLGCSINHAVVDGTSFWNFVNAWAELTRHNDKPIITTLSRTPDFTRTFFPNSTAILRYTPPIPFPSSFRERILHFSSSALQSIKRAVPVPVSSFQSLCALLWISITRARKNLTVNETTFRMAVNCRGRVTPKIDALYFGNAIQSIATTVKITELVENGVAWAAARLNAGVVAHDDARIRKGVKEWEEMPRCFPLGNPDGAGVTMGSGRWFPMYDGNDFGWGPPKAVRSGRNNKFDGKISAFPAGDGEGGVDLEVCLAPETMAGLLMDEEFMRYVSNTGSC